MSVTEILSQDEIDALLAAIAAEEAVDMENDEDSIADVTQTTTNQRDVKPYDFARPNKLSKEQLRTLHIMHENFARGLATSLSGYLRTFVEAEVTTTDAMLYEEFARQVSNPGIMAIFSVPPLEGRMILEITPTTGFSILDRLLGGPGTVPSTMRELTELEQPVIIRVIDRILESFGSAWDHVVNIEPRFEQLELNPQFTQLIPPKEMVVVIGLELSWKNSSGRINLCIPYDVIEPVVPKLSAHYLFISSKKETTPEQMATIHARLRSLTVPLRVVLGQADVSIHELLELQAGDYIPLDTKANSPLPLYIGPRAKFYGRPGRMGTKMAVEIVGKVEDEEAFDK